MTRRKTAAERQRAARRRHRENRYPARAYPRGWAIERAIAAGLLTDETSHDPEAVGQVLDMIFEAWAHKIVTP